MGIYKIDGGGCVYMHAPHLCDQHGSIADALGESVYGRPGKECGLAHLRVFSKHLTLYRVSGLVNPSGKISASNKLQFAVRKRVLDHGFEKEDYADTLLVDSFNRLCICACLTA